jgi:hypothetical protein
VRKLVEDAGIVEFVEPESADIEELVKAIGKPLNGLWPSNLPVRKEQLPVISGWGSEKRFDYVAFVFPERPGELIYGRPGSVTGQGLMIDDVINPNMLVVGA